MTLEGVDVSNNNAGVLPAGVQFAWIKASEGSTYDDRYFEGYVAECNRRGIPWGPYHFPHPDVNSPDVEAAWFLRNAQRGAMGWALDVEKRRASSGITIDPLAIMGPVRLAAWCDRFRALVEPTLGRSWHYTFRSYATPLWPRLSSTWSWWLSTMEGHPIAESFAGRPVQIEQYGIVGGIDRNLARVPLTGSPTPAPGDEEDMVPPLIFQLTDTNGDLVIVPGGGARPWSAKASDQSLVAVFVFRVLDPDPTHKWPFPSPIPLITDPAQVAEVKGWLQGIAPAGAVPPLHVQLSGVAAP